MIRRTALGGVGAVLLLGGASGFWAAYLTDPPAQGGIVALSRIEILRCGWLALSLSAFPFGVVFLSIIGSLKNSPLDEINLSYGKTIGMYFALAVFADVGLQGPAWLASSLGKDRIWADSIHDSINGLLLSVVALGCFLEARRRAKRTSMSSAD